MSSQGPTRPTPSSVHQAALRALTNHLLNHPLEQNRLHHIQALDDVLRPDKNQAATSEVTTALTTRAQKQALNLDQALNRNIAFEEKQAQIAGFLTTIRQHISEPKITTQHVVNAMQALLKQFDDKALALKKAVMLTERAELAASELARIQKESAAVTTTTASSSSSPDSNSSLDSSSTPNTSSSPNSSSPPDSSSTPNTSSSPDSSSTPNPSSTPDSSTTPSSSSASPSIPLSNAQSNTQKTQAAAAEAKSIAEKPTDIFAHHEGLFRAFVAHTLRHRAILEAITFELQFHRQDTELTKEDHEVALAAWEPILAGKANRLADVERSGGRYTGIQTRVAEWNRIAPIPLSDEQMEVRKQLIPYIPEQEEPIEKRHERLSKIAGYGPSTKQLQDKAVAKNLGLKSSGAALSLAKQLHELDDPRRAEFETLGIKPIPKNKQTFVGAFIRTATGSQMWSTIFEDTPTPETPNPPRRTMLEEGIPLAFPERKALAMKALLPGLERHLKIGSKTGYLVGKKTKPTDAYLPIEDSAELNHLMENLKKIRL